MWFAVNLGELLTYSFPVGTQGNRPFVSPGKVVDSIFRVGDAWVWNGIGKP